MAFRVVAALAVSASASVNIGGLTFPTSVAWDTAGRVYVAELAGRVRVAESWSANQTSRTLFDISSSVAASHGYSQFELGLTSIAVGGAYLYGVYSVYNPAVAGRDCSGVQAAGVPSWALPGCPTAGRLSRWEILTNGSAGPEVILVDGVDKMCSQFDKLGPDSVEMGPDGAVYVSVGVGANEAAGPDWGQFGTNVTGADVCTASPSFGWGGAFRALLNLSSSSWGGKVVRVSPANASDWRVVARGLHNPWRFGFTSSGAMYVSDTGSGRGIASSEEVNGPIDVSGASPPPSFGYPCMAGNNVPQPAYANLSSPLCASGAANAAFSPPLFSYNAGTFNASSASVSALAVAQGRIYVGDYSLGRIFSISPQGDDLRSHVTAGVLPVDMAWTGSELVYVNMAENGVGPGSVRSVPGGPPSGASAAGLLTTVAAVAVGAATVLLL